MAEEKTCDCDKRPTIEKHFGPVPRNIRKWFWRVVLIGMLALFCGVAYGIATGTFSLTGLM